MYLLAAYSLLGGTARARSAGGLGLLLLCAAALSGCGGGHQDVGQYRIMTATDGLLGLRCQPRTELYFLERSAAGTRPVYLGTCGTPSFISDSMGLLADPSCFAVAADGAALVYLHRPEWCGAGEAARSKPGGVYRHSAAHGDALLYSSAEHVGQIWGRAEVPPGAMRVSWKNARPSASGAVCSQQLLIYADGREVPIGEPATVHGCLAGRDETIAGD